jgi:hypothetical protein
MGNDRLLMWAIGAYAHGALALGGIIAVAIWIGDRNAALLAIVSAGLAYVAQILGAHDYRIANGLVVLASIGVGVWAFLRIVF